MEAAKEKVAKDFEAKVAARATEEEVKKALIEAKQEVKFWKAKVHSTEAQVEATKAQAAKRLDVAKAEWRKELGEEKVKAVEHFQSSDKFKGLMGDYNTNTYLINVADCHAEVEVLFLEMDVGWLDEGAPVVEAPEEAEILPMDNPMTEGGDAPLLPT